MKHLLLILLFLSLFFSCIHKYKYYTGTFSDTPINLTFFNTAYDDYNSTIRVIGGTMPFCFSTNRKTYGGRFDIIFTLLDVYMNEETGIINIGENNNSNLGVYLVNENLKEALTKINTDKDELGPYIFYAGYKTEINTQFYNQYIFLYSTNNNKDDNFDIQFTENVTSSNYSNPKEIRFLNSSKDDLYPTLVPSLDYNSNSYNSILFCSNRDGNFDIFSAKLNENDTNLISTLSDTSQKRSINKEEIFSSEYDDKCPSFVNGTKSIVFTSNRPGGYGGFDLYYSVYDNGKWSEPKNFGPKINTEYDEYRPIAFSFYEFTNNFMVFSSNRPGGKGGFDLYYVGIDKVE